MPRKFKDSEEAWIFTRNSTELADYARQNDNAPSAQLWERNAETAWREHLRLAADEMEG